MGGTKIVVIVGPTAVGKSRLAVKLCKDFDGAVINADSVQVYRYLDIGTAKPSMDEMAGVPHRLIGIIEPDRPFSAAEFKEAAVKEIKGLEKCGKKAFVVGGTGLYVKILTGGIINVPPVDESIRKELKAYADAKGVHVLYEELKAVDAETAGKLSGSDLFRIVRALEVYRATGVPVSKIRAEHAFKEKTFTTLMIGLTLKREKLYERIEMRVDGMIKAGLEEEVRRLREMGYTKELKPLSSIGYKQMMMYLDGEINHDEAVRLIKRDTKRYAKRQFTWFNKDKEIEWYDADDVLSGDGYGPVMDRVEAFFN